LDSKLEKACLLKTENQLSFFFSSFHGLQTYDDGPMQEEEEEEEEADKNSPEAQQQASE
jgi:hypothetical protein